MLIAHKNDGSPFTVEVMGATFTFTPISRPMIMRARRAGRPALAADAPGSAEDQVDEFGSAVSLALLMEGLTGWDGVVDPVAEGDAIEGAIEADGTLYRPLDCTTENKARLLSDAVIFDALDAAYVMPFVTRERAKNVPAGSSNGTSTRVTPATTTAAPRAAGKRGAKSAPTRNSRSKTKTSN